MFVHGHGFSRLACQRGVHLGQFFRMICKSSPYSPSIKFAGGGNWILVALLSNSRGKPFDPGGLVGRGEMPIIIREATEVGAAA